MSPEYFHNALTFGEADDYLGGMNRRCRHGYAQARMVQSIIGQLFAKDYKVQEFPWEEEENGKRKAENGKAPTEEEMKDLLKEAREWEKRLNERPTPTSPRVAPVSAPLTRHRSTFSDSSEGLVRPVREGALNAERGLET